MCGGIALQRSEIPDVTIERYKLGDRISTRHDGSEPEIRFLNWDKQPLLPTWLDGQLLILEWGNRSAKNCKLPLSSWCKIESLEGGKWAWMQPAEAWIPASAGIEKGRWFAITEGIRAIVVQDARAARVYMLTEPASHYYRIMTGHDRMPVFINQVIG